MEVIIREMLRGLIIVRPKLNSMFDKMTLYQCVVRGRTSVTTTFCG